MIKKYDHLDQMTFFKLVHLAYEKVIDNHHKKETIFYHIHNPRADVLFNFINHAPNAKWLVMVRDPVEGCEAWISQLFNENNYTDIVQRIVAVLLDVNNNFKTYDELSARFHAVISGATTVGNVSEEMDDEPVATPVVDTKPVESSITSQEEEEDTMDYFSKLANG